MTLVALLLVFAAPPSAEVAPPTFHAANEELAAYLLEAANNSPGLQMRFAEWRAALQRVPQVTALDDPQFTYTQFVQSDQTRFGVSLMQMFPWFGTLRLRGEQAVAEADAALARLYVERNALFQEVKEAYFDYAFLQESLDTTKRQADILKEMEDTVANRYSLGLAAEADLLRVQIEQSELEDLYNQYLQERPVFSQRLASAVGREASEELPWPQATSAPPPAPPAPAVMAWLRVQNPALQESDATIESRRRGIELAKKQGRPNFTVGLEFEDMKQPKAESPEWPYMAGVEAARGVLAGDAAMVQEARDFAVNSYVADELMPGMDRMSDDIMVSVGMNLPIWRRRIRAGIEEAKQMEQAAISEKRDRILDLDVEARMALFEIQDGMRRYNLYNDVLVPRARQTYESLMSRYASGETMASFLDVLGAVQTLLNYELEQVRALRDIQVGAARLERVMGGPWTDKETAPEEKTAPAPTPEVTSEPLPEPSSPSTGESVPAPPFVPSAAPEREPLGPSVPSEDAPQPEAQPAQEEDSPLPSGSETVPETSIKTGTPVGKGEGLSGSEANATRKSQANRYSVRPGRPRSRGRS